MREREWYLPAILSVVAAGGLIAATCVSTQNASHPIIQEHTLEGTTETTVLTSMSVTVSASVSVTVMSEETAAASTTEQTTLPTISETKAPAGRYDINTVTRQELLCIEGVDGEMADSILKLREQVRGIEHLYELLYIDGMTNELFHRLEEHLYVDPATSDLRHP